MLPPAVRRFIEERIDDVAQLEMVMLLERHDDRWWSAPEVADALCLPRRQVERQLETVARRNLVDVRLSTEVRYRYSPAVAELADAVRLVADCYRDRRAETLTFAATRGRHALRAFSEAFRFGREHDDA